MKFNLVALSSRVSELANRFLVKELEKRGIKGIVPSHGGILLQLYNNKSLTMKSLAEKINRTKPTVTVLINKLIAEEYVTKEKCPIDSRVSFIKLTDKGKALEPLFFEISKDMNNKVYENLTKEEAKQVELLMEKVLLNLQE